MKRIIVDLSDSQMKGLRRYIKSYDDGKITRQNYVDAISQAIDEKIERFDEENEGTEPDYDNEDF